MRIVIKGLRVDAGRNKRLGATGGHIIGGVASDSPIFNEEYDPEANKEPEKRKRKKVIKAAAGPSGLVSGGMDGDGGSGVGGGGN